VRVPAEAGSGSANVTVSFPGWKAGQVAPATYYLPIVTGDKDSDWGMDSLHVSASDGPTVAQSMGKPAASIFFKSSTEGERCIPNKMSPPISKL
jgi:hypothetical protein